MDAFVVYHSETGNTLKVALSIVSGLKKAGVGVKALPVEEADASEAAHFELIALGTPVHAFTASKTIRDFAKKLPEGGGKKAIVFATHGLHKGFALKSLEKKLVRRGYDVVDFFSCPGRDSWPPAKLIGLSRGRPNDQDLARAHGWAENLNLK